MLYLAEVQKKSGGVFGGGGKADLKLLACQRSEQNWTAVPTEETIPSDEANNYAAGALVLVDLTANRQVQRIQEAGRPLVSILQNFSRLQEKFKTQEEEIEQWKQSLTFQSQELNRREMEMESRREQLQQMEDDFEQLERRRQEIEALQEEANRQKEEFERNRQELEGAWEHLRGETRRLEEQKGELQQSASLDEDTARSLQETLNHLSGAVPPTESIRESINISLEALNQQQTELSQHWQTLEHLRATVAQEQSDIDRQAQDLQHQWQEWHQAQEALEQARIELKAQQTVLATKQDQARMLSVQVQGFDDLQQQICRMAETSDSISIGGQQVDVEVLERMSIDELQRITQDLERDLEKLNQFVEGQEEELRLKQQEINEIQAKIDAANDFDRLNLENDLADEQDAYQMLNETLVGQRNSLRSRKGILSQHQMVLRRRQGIPAPAGEEASIDLGPLLGQIEAQRQQRAEELQTLEAQIEQMQSSTQQTQDMVNSQIAEQEAKKNGLKQAEEALKQRQSSAAELQGKVNLYQEMLQPIQNYADTLRQQLETLNTTGNQLQETSDYQLQAIAEMRQTIVTLVGTPELAAS